VQYQLRIYRVKPGELDEWLAEWKEKIVPLRRRFGFDVVSTWVNRGRDTHVWLLGYDGTEDWQTADAGYYASAERKTIEPDPARHLEQTTHLRLEPLELDA
jgi:hypothetical protein